MERRLAASILVMGVQRLRTQAAFGARLAGHRPLVTSTTCHMPLVIDNATDEWHGRLRACVRAKGGHFK